MRKIIATINTAGHGTNNKPFEYQQVDGYEVEAWGAKMIVTRELGSWQVYDIDSRMVVVRVANSRKNALELLEVTEQEVPLETYQKCVAGWKHNQGRIRESEQSILFRLNTARNGAI